MRDIKFRAWCKDEKMMQPVHGIDFEEKTIQYYGISDQPFHNIILMQYTGLKGKNGREIYEGDIVFVPATTLTKGEGGYMQEEGNQAIVWDWAVDGRCCETYYMGFSIMKGERVVPHDVEVIGNIYENPELMKGEK